MILHSSSNFLSAPKKRILCVVSNPEPHFCASSLSRTGSAGTGASESRTAHKALTNWDLSSVENRDLRCIRMTPLAPGLRALMKNQKGERESERGRDVHADAGSDIVTYSLVAFLFSPRCRKAVIMKTFSSFLLCPLCHGLPAAL